MHMAKSISDSWLTKNRTKLQGNIYTASSAGDQELLILHNVQSTIYGVVTLSMMT